MGPYRYKTVVLDIGYFGSFKGAEKKIQSEIDKHVADDWELFSFHPIKMLVVWRWNLLIFRQPEDSAP